MDTHAVHLALAAIVGASVVAVSAYYMHRKTLAQLLEFARTVEREADAGGSDAESPPAHAKKRRGSSRKRRNGGYRRGSASLPDVTAISGGFDGDEKRNGPVHVEGIPAGLPRLHTLREGMAAVEISRFNLGLCDFVVFYCFSRFFFMRVVLVVLCWILFG